MSQRLHIGNTKDEFYDCVLESADGAEEKLRADWLAMGNGFYLGPWKIRIGDKNLFKEIEPIIAGIFEELGKEYPDDVWAFYDGERNLEHPTREELGAWLWPNAEVSRRRSRSAGATC